MNKKLIMVSVAAILASVSYVQSSMAAISASCKNYEQKQKELKNEVDEFIKNVKEVKTKSDVSQLLLNIERRYEDITRFAKRLEQAGCFKLAFDTFELIDPLLAKSDEVADQGKEKNLISESGYSERKKVNKQHDEFVEKRKQALFKKIPSTVDACVQHKFAKEKLATDVNLLALELDKITTIKGKLDKIDSLYTELTKFLQIVEKDSCFQLAIETLGLIETLKLDSEALQKRPIDNERTKFINQKRQDLSQKIPHSAVAAKQIKPSIEQQLEETVKRSTGPAVVPLAPSLGGLPPLVPKSGTGAKPEGVKKPVEVYLPTVWKKVVEVVEKQQSKPTTKPTVAERYGMKGRPLPKTPDVLPKGPPPPLPPRPTTVSEPAVPPAPPLPPQMFKPQEKETAKALVEELSEHKPLKPVELEEKKKFKEEMGRQLFEAVGKQERFLEQLFEGKEGKEEEGLGAEWELEEDIPSVPEKKQPSVKPLVSPPKVEAKTSEGAPAIQKPLSEEERTALAKKLAKMRGPQDDDDDDDD